MVEAGRKTPPLIRIKIVSIATALVLACPRVIPVLTYTLTTSSFGHVLADLDPLARGRVRASHFGASTSAPPTSASLRVSACRFGAAHVSATTFSATDLYQFFSLLGYVFFYSKDGDQYYTQIIMKDSAVFIIINIHKLDFVLLLLNTIIQHILQVACKSRPKWSVCFSTLMVIG